MSIRIPFVFAIVFFLSNCQTNEPETYYAFSYFSGIPTDSTGNGQDGLHLAVSTDLLNWETVNNGISLLKPNVGGDKLMRDPCIAKGPDSKYHMVWTVSWEEPTIGYSWSEDLIHWSAQKAIKPFENEPLARNCWAPEITWDPSNQEWMIYWSTTIPGRFPETDSSNIKGRNHRIYYTLSKDFESFSPTALLYEPGFNCIDASIYPHNKGWVMFIKDETRYPVVAKNIKIAYSDSLTGPYTDASEPITHHWVEGPTAMKTDSVWYLFYDEYPTEKHEIFKIGLMKSANLEEWTDISEQLSMPEGVRHGTIFKIPKEVYNELKQL